MTVSDVKAATDSLFGGIHLRKGKNMRRLLIAAVPILAVAAYFLLPMEQSNRSETPESAERIALRVDGMTCAGCAVSVRFALNGLEGVYETEVDVEGSKAVVAYAPEKVTIDQMVQAINATGFKAHRPTSG